MATFIYSLFTQNKGWGLGAKMGAPRVKKGKCLFDNPNTEFFYE